MDRPVHDRGGWPTDEPTEKADHEWADWEHQTSAIQNLLSARGIINADQMRRAIESIPTAEYESMTYFERWSAAIEQLLTEKGVLEVAEVDRKAPDWYKSLAYRSRAVNEPRSVMREFGLELGDDVEVRVVDSLADLRYMVLPRRPAGTDDMSEKELAKLVTRDSLIGVGDPLTAEAVH